MTQAINSDNVWLEATRQLSTPSLVIDLPRVRRNVTRLASYVETHGLRLRPHTKTHKSKKMGMLQLEAGAKGLTAANIFGHLRSLYSDSPEREQCLKGCQKLSQKIGSSRTSIRAAESVMELL